MQDRDGPPPARSGQAAGRCHFEAMLVGVFHSGSLSSSTGSSAERLALKVLITGEPPGSTRNQVQLRPRAWARRVRRSPGTSLAESRACAEEGAVQADLAPNLGEAAADGADPSLRGREEVVARHRKDVVFHGGAFRSRAGEALSTLPVTG